MTEQEVCRYFLRSLKDPCYDLMLIVHFEDLSQLINMREDIDFETQEEHMAPLIGTQLSTMRGREVPDDPTSLVNCLNQLVPITLNTSALSVVPRIPPLLEYKKAIKPFNVPTIPSTWSPSPPTSCIAIHPSKPHLYTSNRIVNQAKGTRQKDVHHAKTEISLRRVPLEEGFRVPEGLIGWDFLCLGLRLKGARRPYRLRLFGPQVEGFGMLEGLIG
ncbi:uncharacterized protein G2W53_021849 [Senna tora]|uniref:Uncharacterized protein n=1 Tax=Senna tora TaxID=362788 RepID=A0A834TN60_9FABA|nr:uncharacterized protein G2W53_021849 [Senna tora]